jgi:NAD(P)-dependent dehydrogenase (short-subunit alcohol dehydrogenase family)
LTIEVRQVDVSQPADVSSAVDTAVSRFGALDIVVNAAAIHPFGTAVETDLETWNRCFQVNVTSIFLFAHFAIPEMAKRRRGAIVNLASVQGYACQQGVAAYATSKGAIHSLTRALALDHAKDGVRVNSISPGSIRTPMLEYAARKLALELPLEEV